MFGIIETSAYPQSPGLVGVEVRIHPNTWRYANAKGDAQCCCGDAGRNPACQVGREKDCRGYCSLWPRNPVPPRRGRGHHTEPGACSSYFSVIREISRQNIYNTAPAVARGVRAKARHSGTHRGSSIRVSGGPLRQCTADNVPVRLNLGPRPVGLFTLCTCVLTPQTGPFPMGLHAWYHSPICTGGRAGTRLPGGVLQRRPVPSSPVCLFSVSVPRPVSFWCFSPGCRFEKKLLRPNRGRPPKGTKAYDADNAPWSWTCIPPLPMACATCAAVCAALTHVRRQEATDRKMPRWTSRKLSCSSPYHVVLKNLCKLSEHFGNVILVPIDVTVEVL